MHLDELIEGLKDGKALAVRRTVARLELLQKRHKMAVRGGKRVCGNCSRGHDMKALVLWPCADWMILSGVETEDPNPAVETHRPGVD